MITLITTLGSTARAAFEVSRDYAKERETFGQPIATRQAIAFMLADMAIEIDGARLLIWEAAAALDRGEPAGRLARLAQDQMMRIGLRVADGAVQVFGGHGYIQDHPVEKWMRDAKINDIYEGTQQINQLIVARRILDYPSSMLR